MNIQARRLFSTLQKFKKCHCSSAIKSSTIEEFLASTLSMKAYKLKGKVNQDGQLVLTEPIDLMPGDVEIIVLQEAEIQTDMTPTPQKREYKVQALKALLENAPPTPSDFDPDQARWEYLKEKHNL